ncbi:MAG: chitinase [Flavobacteriales bacterium]|nr:chitinase [Flavobacteriales bacterium]
MRSLSFLLQLCFPLLLAGQGHDLIGYWHNWNDANAPYMDLDAVDPRYTVIDIAFAEPLPGTTYDMAFAPSGTPQATFIAQVAALRAQGKKVLISIGGANATVHLNSDAERDQFVSSLLGIVLTYGFDGIDIDLEGASVSITGGTIASPTGAATLRLIAAITAIGCQFEAATGTPMMLTMAPETAYVQGGMSAFGSIWGAYLPIIDALRDRIDVLHVQLYNSGSMYGIDGGIYEQGTADFIVSQTEAVIQGFSTSGGAFAGLPAGKIAIGLPACPSAAGGGYVAPGVLADAVRYLLGTGPQPGNYALTATYPDLRGLMTWSINWDAAGACAGSDEYAQSYEDLFGLSTGAEAALAPLPLVCWPTVLAPGGSLRIGASNGPVLLEWRDMGGRLACTVPAASTTVPVPEQLAPGIYHIVLRSPNGPARSARVVVRGM